VTLGRIISDRLKALGLSRAAFARKVGVKPPMIFAVEKSKSPIPGARIEQWADALELKGKDREAFVDEAWLSRSPEHVRAMVEKLRKQIPRH